MTDSEYCKKHGIIPDSIILSSKERKLIYYANHPVHVGANEGKTYKVTVDLNSGIEKRKLLKNWDRRGNRNLFK